MSFRIAALPFQMALATLTLSLGVACTDAPVAESPQPVQDAVAVDGVCVDELCAPEDAEPTADLAPGEVTAICPGGAGCPCAGNDACDIGLCIETPTGGECARPCSGTCPTNQKCANVPKGTDIISVCVYRWGRLCEPCDTSATCSAALASEDAACVAYGGLNGSFCASPCGGNADCPTGYTCGAGKTVEGKTVQQCLRTADATGTVACPCSARASGLKLATACTAAAAKGVCPGLRSCSAGAKPGTQGTLGPCSAAPAAQESCDGIDNDCNGLVDDGLCDDKNPCTENVCDAKAAACSHPANTLPCTDGNACTSPDLCAAGACKGGLTDCDDKNPCTDDTCDPATGCVHAPHNKPCTDFNACTANDLCNGQGACKGLALDVAVACKDNNPCTADLCDQATGCQNPAQPGTCDDGNPCTNGDACASGACKGGENVCKCTTTEECKANEDKDLCNGTLFCDKAVAPFACKVDPTTIVTCSTASDGPCKKTGCEAATGNCKVDDLGDGKACDADGSACTGSDACKAGVCAPGAAIACDDKNPCTDDTCDPKSGCKTVHNVAACSDGNGCTSGDTCSGGACVAGKKTVCDDNSVCTIDSCDSKSGLCVYAGAALEGDGCDADGSVCTIGDKCGAGVCVAGIKKVCDDGNVCTTDACDAKTGCTYVNHAGACEFDDNPCTPKDFCKNGACSPGPKKDCDDKQTCTIDTCDAKTGNCQHFGAPLEGSACEDGSKCTASDTCVLLQAGNPAGGKCASGKVVSCDDAKVCTADSCEAIKGCLHSDLAGPCNDGDPCSKGDVCGAGLCKGIKLECDDKNACTIESCDAVTGCVHTPVANGSACGTAQYCVKGTCVTPSCGDGYVPTAKPEEFQEICDDGNTKACDGCEACLPQHALTLDGKGYGTAAVTPGAAGTLQGALGLDQDLTLEAWVKPANHAAEQAIVAKGHVNAGAPASTFALGLVGGSGKLYFHHGGPEGAETFASNTVVPIGQWSHVSVSVATDEVRMFVNGQPVLQAPVTKIRTDAAGVPVLVGRRYADSPVPAFVGSIDEVHLAAAALHGGAFVPSRRTVAGASTRALWRFDDAKAGSALDSGPHGNTLVLTSATYVKDACFGAAADVATCGDGKIAAAFEQCDDGNVVACDGCEACHSQQHLDVAGKAVMYTAPLGTWAADTFCPTCEVTVEAWVKIPGPQSAAIEVFGTSCGYLSVNYVQGKFGLYRNPEPLCQGSIKQPGKWYHVAAVAGWTKGAEFRLYVDGKLECTKIATQPVTYAPDSTKPVDMTKEVLFVGSGASTGSGCQASGAIIKAGNFWPGGVDEARVSVGMRYTDDFTPARRLLPDRQTRALWRFDDGAKPPNDDGGHEVKTTATDATYVKDTCFGELSSAAVCGDSQPAKWEACDSGNANGPYPKQCSSVCASNVAPDCTGISWPTKALNKDLPEAKNVMTYAAGGWTVEGWVRIPAFPATGDGVLVGVDDYAIYPPMPKGQAWRVAVGPSGFDTSYLGGTAQTASKTRPVWKTKTWQHFALQYHGLGKGSLYVDGAKARDFAGVNAAWATGAPLRLGNATNTAFLAGDVGSVRLSQKTRYGQAFSPAWTLAADAATLWLFDFLEGTGATSQDAAAKFTLDLKPAGSWLKTGPGCL